MISNVLFTSHARADLYDLDAVVRDCIIAALRRLVEEIQGDLIGLRERAGEWRLRVDDWRIVLALGYEENAIYVLRVQYRNEFF